MIQDSLTPFLLSLSLSLSLAWVPPSLQRTPSPMVGGNIFQKPSRPFLAPLHTASAFCRRRPLALSPLRFPD